MSATKRALAVALAVVVVGCVVVFWSRFKTDFLPPDRSYVGPNLVASVVQWAIIFLAAVLFYPPFRRAVDRYVTRQTEDLKAHVTAEHAKLHARLHALEDSHVELHRKLDELKVPQ